MKVLVIAAHPDDEVLGMGGTIAKLTSLRHEVHVLIVTDGSSSQYRDDPNLQDIIIKKRQETELCASILGVTKVHYGMLPDMRLDSIPHVEINKVIEELVQELKPQVVYTHFWGDVNVDHQEVFRSTMVAVRPTSSQSVEKVYCYNVPSSTEWAPQVGHNVFNPTVFVKISDFVDIKETAIKSYATELREFPHPRSVEYIKTADKYTGLSVGCDSAEGFIVIRDTNLL